MATIESVGSSTRIEGAKLSDAEVEDLLSRAISIRSFKTRDEQEVAGYAEAMDLVFEAAAVHRAHFDPNQVQVSTLLSIKTGGCPEDCGYCSQSAHFKTPVAREPLIRTKAWMALRCCGLRPAAGRVCMN